jgi:hypothetical protein
MGGVTRHDGVNIFHMHNIENKKDVACWHCCEQFDGHGIPLPRLYDPNENIYHVFGHFCSPSCCKAYVLEHVTFDRGQHMNVLVRMLREVYGIHERVIEAPPRISLKRFGGMFDIQEFRNMHNVCAVCQPPFVSYCMVIEERMPQHSMGEVAIDAMRVDHAFNEDEDISEQPTAAMYVTFLKQKQEEASGNDSTDPEATVGKSSKMAARKRKVPPSTRNSLTRYATGTA